MNRADAAGTPAVARSGPSVRHGSAGEAVATAVPAVALRVLPLGLSTVPLGPGGPDDLRVVVGLSLRRSRQPTYATAAATSRAKTASTTTKVLMPER